MIKTKKIGDYIVKYKEDKNNTILTVKHRPDDNRLIARLECNQKVNKVLSKYKAMQSVKKVTEFVNKHDVSNRSMFNIVDKFYL